MRTALFARHCIFILTLILFGQPSYSSPDKVTLTGTITDSETGEGIPGASLYIPELKSGSVSDKNGKYSIPNLPAKKIVIQVTAIGYRTILQHIDLSVVHEKNFLLYVSAREIREIVVTGSSHVVERNKTPTPVTIIPKSLLSENPSSNIIDALATQPGVSQVSTGNAISKPVIRGLGFNRVVVVQDGIRQEGQQWGDEHGLEIDPNSADKIEILKGPASLAYGSDAIAGVINILSAPALPEGQVQGTAAIKYGTNPGLYGFTANISGNKKGFIFDLRYSNAAAHDYKNKNDGYVFNSRYMTNSAAGTVGFNRSWGYLHLSLSSFHLNTGIVEGERDSSTGSFTREIKENDSTTMTTVVSNSQYQSYHKAIPFQEINHYKVALNSSFIMGKSTFKALLGLQQNRRKEFSNPLTPSEYGLYFLLNTLTYDVKYILPEQSGRNIFVGMNGMYQESLNRGIEFLVPAYRLFDFGVYAIGRKEYDRLDVSGGIRYDRRKESTFSLFVDDRGIPVESNSSGAQQLFQDLHRKFSGVSMSIGATWQLSPISFAKINFATAFRAPNIAELGSNGLHEGTFRYETGNANLSTEKSRQWDLAIGMNTDHVSVELDLFDTRINDYIFLTALTTTSGKDSLKDGNRAFTYTTGDAALRGGEILIDIHPHPLDWLHFENSLSYVHAILRDQPDSMKYLPLTPATKITSEVKVTSKSFLHFFKNPFFKFGMEVYLDQNHFYKAFNTETATRGYIIVNAGLGAEISVRSGKKQGQVLQLQFNVSNLTDVAYQSHLSRLKYAPENLATGRRGVFNTGRSFAIKLGVNL